MMFVIGEQQHWQHELPHFQTSQGYACSQGGNARATVYWSRLSHCPVQVLEEAKASDLLFWASRYHIFVVWSTDRKHPWDMLDNSEAAAATLEIGRLPGTEDKARLCQP